MATIMERWVSVKTDVLSETERLKTCFLEARNIIHDRCRQSVLDFNLQDFTLGVLSRNGDDTFCRGSWADDVCVHWYGSLSYWENTLAYMKSVTTGTLVALWESEQQES